MTNIYSKDHRFIVKQLKKVRLELGLSQKEVADALSKTQSYISKLESGQRKIDIVQLKKLAKIYKQSVDYFLK